MGLENFKVNINMIQQSSALGSTRKKQLLTNFVKDIEYMCLSAPHTSNELNDAEAQQLVETLHIYLQTA